MDYLKLSRLFFRWTGRGSGRRQLHPGLRRGQEGNQRDDEEKGSRN